MKKIIDVIPTSSLFYVVKKRYDSYGMSNREITPARYKVIAWALVEGDNGQRWTEPLILGQRALILMDETSEWSIEAT